MFTLHQRLLQDTYFIGKLPLCRILLMNNKLFPWVILVPEREGITEIFQLNEKDRKNMIDEIALVSKALKDSYHPDKINVGALGNQVEQLHIHIIARFKTDTCWPEPVWGKGAELYDEQNALEIAEKIRTASGKLKDFITTTHQP
jgi:diadenosine tetraphosphate (Ap4A) HIT family hydrolase